MEMTFRDWLAAELSSRHLTQAEFAKSVGVHQGVVSRWLNQTEPNTPSAESCRKIADALGVDRDAVLTVAGHREPSGDDSGASIMQVAQIQKELDDVIDYMTAALARLSLQRSQLNAQQQSPKNGSVAVRSPDRRTTRVSVLQSAA